MAAPQRVIGPTQCGTTESDPEEREGRPQTRRPSVYAGSGFSGWGPGKAPSDMPALQPYWGKLAVRNDRGERGDVGKTGPRLVPTRPDERAA